MSRKKPRAKLKLGRTTVLVLLLASFILVGAGIGFLVGAIRTMPHYDLENITGDLSSFILDKDNQVATSLKADKNRVQLEPNEIPLVMKEAIIAIEDQRFYKHHGIDIWRLGGAVLVNLTKGSYAQGGSTLTQQLVKQAILENPEKKMRRKVQEAIIAFQVESKYTKEQILTMYLNNVYYGHGAWSLQTAAQVYFGKDAKDLTLEEAAMLAGVINAPGRYSPYLNMDKAKQRQALVLNEMVKMNYINQDTADKTKAKPLKLAGLKQNTYKYQSFVDYVVEEATDKLKMDSTDVSTLYTAGYKIYTTMDTKTQEAAEAVFADDKNFPPNKGTQIVQGAMVVLDPHTGEIRTMIGGRNRQGERQFNRAVDALRQPGSSFKPIAVYGPALESGYSPATVLDDYPEEYPTPNGPKKFVNFDSRYRGLISMRTGIQYSINTVAVKMLQKIGVNEGFKFAQKMGITSLVESGKSNDMSLSLALGGLTKGVSPLEMAAAYGAFDNQGIYVKPFAIRKIEDKDGNLLYENKTTKTVVMSPQTAYLMTDMLQTVVQAGTGTRAQMGDRPVAGKTGTTSFDVDAWFMGYTPNLVGAVWLGFDKEENMNGTFGGTVGGPIWKKVMTVAHQSLPVTGFTRPDGIVNATVDYKSGILPSSLTPPEFVVDEVFNSSNVPAEISPVWVQLPVCADTGQLLTPSCPSSVTHIFLKRPIPWTGDIPPEDASLEAPTSNCTLHGGGASSGNGGTPGTPTTLRLEGNSVIDANNNLKAIRLSWYNPNAAALTGYKIYRSTQSGFPLSSASQVAEVGSKTSFWQDYKISPSTSYYYRIVAESSQVSGQSISNEIFVQTPKTNEALPAPKLNGSVSIVNSVPSVKLSWTKDVSNRSVIYYLYRSETNNFEPAPSNQIATADGADLTAITDLGVTRKKTYYYRIVAADSETGQKSPYSNQLAITIN